MSYKLIPGQYAVLYDLKGPFMSSYETINVPAAQASETDRAAFVGLVYQHIAAAVAAFVAFEGIFFATGVADAMRDFFFSGGGGARWLLLMGGVMVVQWFSANAAADMVNPSRQYVGLFGSAFAQALIFAPFLSYVFQQSDGGATVAQAAIITAIGFAMLTAIGLFTRKDLSFLRPLVMWGFGVALLAIIAAVLFGFALGTWFSVAMIGLSGDSLPDAERRSALPNRLTCVGSDRAVHVTDDHVLVRATPPDVAKLTLGPRASPSPIWG
jgi:FtsH-binding integral membrane protein